jgi:hypothetical protein
MDYSSLGIIRINPPNRQEAVTGALLFRSLLCVCLAGLNPAYDALPHGVRGTVAANCRYVSPAGSDTNDGSASQP